MSARMITPGQESGYTNEGDEMTRVAIIGNAGGGKSTMARKLAAARGLPYFAVDKFQWRPG